MNFSQNIRRFDSTVNNYLSIIDNDYVAVGLAMFFVMYASLAAPKLPTSATNMLNNSFIRFVAFFMIAYNTRRNPTLALISSVSILIAIHLMNTGMPNVMVFESVYDSNDLIEKPIDPEEKQIEGMTGESEDAESTTCQIEGNYRNKFYPQYVNMKPWAYAARYNGNTVDGYDSASKYSTL
jgi:hypothetical protein